MKTKSGPTVGRAGQGFSVAGDGSVSPWGPAPDPAWFKPDPTPMVVPPPATTPTTPATSTSLAPSAAPDIALPDRLPARPFVAPDAEAVFMDPGYQARMRSGMRALEASKAATGNLRTTGTMKELAQFGADLGTEVYGDLYDRAARTHAINSGENVAAYDRDLNAAQLRYAPSLLTWQQGNRVGELNFDRDWQREIYGRDAGFRDTQAARDDFWRTRDDDWRRYTYSTDDAWRRFLEEQNTRRYVADAGRF